MSTDKKTPNNIIKDAVNTFSTIANKIDSLIGCSVKDFVILNKNFQEYYKNLQTIAKSVDTFINYCSENLHSSKLDDDLSEAIEKISSINHETQQYLKKYYKRANDTTHILLQINNLKQDLSTLKLLFTNLKFDPSIKTNFPTISENIIAIEDSIRNYDRTINEYLELLNYSITLNDEGISEDAFNLEKQVNETVDQKKFLYSLVEEAEKQKKMAGEISTKIEDSASEIITKLQFQDILRQQIEHVQEAHQTLINNLLENENSEKLDVENQLQIRDIGTLQSAQLIHANQEYQSAVELILNKFSVLNQLLQAQHTLWDQFCRPNIRKVNSVINATSIRLEVLPEKIGSLLKNLKHFDIVNEKIIHAESNIINLKKQNSSLKQNIDSFKNTIETAVSETARKFTSSPLTSISQELKKFENSFKKLMQSCIVFDQELKNDVKTTSNIYNESLSALQIFNMTLATYFSEQLDKLNNDLLIPTFRTGSFDVEQVEYYKSFEQEVLKIIDILDSLLVKININKSEINEKRLNHMRQLYTMESEREVHDLVTRKSSSDNEETNNKQTDDNDIEFF